MNDPVRTPGDSSSQNAAPNAAPSSRRRALIVAMPSILSLHPGVAAAGARSSNVLVLADGTPKKHNGKYYCVKRPDGGSRRGKGYDLGSDNPWVDVYDIPANRTYHKKVRKNRTTKYEPVSVREMCEDESTEFYYPSNKHGYGGYDSAEMMEDGTEGLEFTGYELETLDAEPEATDGDIQALGSGIEPMGGGGSGGGGKTDWKKVHVPNGGLASFAALASFAHCKTHYKIDTL